MMNDMLGDENILQPLLPTKQELEEQEEEEWETMEGGSNNG